MIEKSKTLRKPADNPVLIEVIVPSANKKFNEWIELYNPTAGTIDLSGWTITTKAGTYTFPGAPGSGTTTIGAGQFLVIDNNDFGNNYLKNSEDNVALKDANGIIIDQTGYKGIADGKSWARYKAPGGSDGFDTDQDSDWYKENNPTRGSSNNVMIPEFQTLLLPLGIILLMFILIRKPKYSEKRKIRSDEY